MIALVSVSKANHYGVAVTELNAMQLHQVASCLAKRLHWKSVMVVLMAAGREQVPVHDALTPVIAFTHELWGLLDAACHHGQVCQGTTASWTQHRFEGHEKQRWRSFRRCKFTQEGTSPKVKGGDGEDAD